MQFHEQLTNPEGILRKILSRPFGNLIASVEQFEKTVFLTVSELWLSEFGNVYDGQLFYGPKIVAELKKDPQIEIAEVIGEEEFIFFKRNWKILDRLEAAFAVPDEDLVD